MTWKISVLLLFVPLFLSCGLEKARIKREKNAAAHYKLGIAHLIGNRPSLQKAYIEFQKAIEFDSRHRDAYYALGHIYFERERYKKAISAFKKVNSIDPEYSEAYNYLGRVYSFQGEFNKAMASYRMALKNKKYETPEMPYWNIGLIYFRQKKYKKAISELRNALRVNPDFVPVHNLLGRVYTKMGDTRSATSSYLKAVEIEPENIQAHYNLACIYQLERSEALSETEFNRVIALNPLLKKEEDLRKCLSPIE